MDAHRSQLATCHRGGIGTIRWIGLFVVAWALCTLAEPGSEVAGSTDSYDAAPAAMALVASPSTAPRLPLAPVGDVASLPVETVLAQPARSATPSAERPDPPPSLFHRVSYRTTAPPATNG